MSVKVRPRDGYLQYDIGFDWPDGTAFRERAKSKLPSKSATLAWAQRREAELIRGGKEAWLASKGPVAEATSAPTLGEFWEHFVKNHYTANRAKASTVDAAERIYKLHLQPYKERRLDEFNNALIAELKGRQAERAKSSANNVLMVLSRCLRSAVEWDLLEEMPCRIERLVSSREEMPFYPPEQFRRLVSAAQALGTEAHLVTLLGGSAGLRRGEIVALRWADVDWKRSVLKIRVALWKGEEDTTKGGRGREVPMTPDLVEALKEQQKASPVRRLGATAPPTEGPWSRVICNEEGGDLPESTIRSWMGQACLNAGLTSRTKGLRLSAPMHILRHTYCSHLAMAGVPAKAIQELAGHADLTTTMRYMHLAPGDKADAMKKLAQFQQRAEGE